MSSPESATIKRHDFIKIIFKRKPKEKKKKGTALLSDILFSTEHSLDDNFHFVFKQPIQYSNSNAIYPIYICLLFGTCIKDRTDRNALKDQQIFNFFSIFNIILTSLF